MKNNKGFMLAEIIIVAVIVMTGLVSLFTLTNKLFIQYEEKLTYDNVDAIYVSRGLIEKYGEEIIKTDFYDTAVSYKKLDTNEEYLKKNNIIQSFIIKYSSDRIKTFLIENESSIGDKFYAYINEYININDFSDSSYDNTDENAKTYDYIIFTEIGNNCVEETDDCNNNKNINYGYYKFNYEIEEEVKTETVENLPPVVYDIKITPYNRKTYGNEFERLNDYEVSWASYDPNGTSITKFVVSFYKSDGTVIGNKEITNIEDYLKDGVYIFDQTFFNLPSGKIYVKIYGYDEDEINGLDSCVLDTSLYCGKSEVATIGRLFYTLSPSEDSKITMLTDDNDIYSGGTIQFRASQYTSDLEESQYNFTFESWKVEHLDGNVVGSGTTSGTYEVKVEKDFKVSAVVTKTEKDNVCLAEGTQILLANGKYKNIEDIDYNDLLVVYDHENGNISYQYPIWIETPGMDNEYILVTFDDGSELKVVNDHGIYSLDYNEYVRIKDNDKFRIGSRVVKIKDGKLKEVKVKDIEIIKQEVKHYFMFTSRHFNLITNDILTGTPDVFIYNFHGFNDDLTWKEPLYEDIYSYEELSEVPYYLYSGMRLYEGKYFVNYGMNKEGYLNFLRSTVINDNRTVKPKLNENSKREWMVTTSEDEVTEKNKLSYLMEEGDYYTLKTPKTINGKKFIGWLHTGENIMYQPGDKVEVLYGTHFIAKYQDLFGNNINDIVGEKNE